MRARGGCRNLGSNELSGPLPGSWSTGFGQLQQMDLHGNSFNGNLPDSWGSGINVLQTLQVMDLSSNSLTGAQSCLACYAQFWYVLRGAWWVVLRTPLLRVSRAPAWCLRDPSDSHRCSALSGNLPTKWGASGGFPSLRTLFVNSNNLTGTLPEGWGAPSTLVSLNQLNVASNDLTGTIPESWGASGNLPAIGGLCALPHPLAFLSNRIFLEKNSQRLVDYM